MPVTARLFQKLHEALGEDATTDLLAWWDQSVVTRAELMAVVESLAKKTDLVGGLSELRTELAAAKAELQTEMAGFRSELSTEIQRGLADVRVELANQRAAIAGVRSELLKWMFVFWAGTMIPLAGLILAFRRG